MLLCLCFIALFDCMLVFVSILGNRFDDRSRISLDFYVIDPLMLDWLFKNEELSLSIMFFAGLGALFPKAYLRNSSVFFDSVICLLAISRIMFLFLWIRILESCCLWQSYSSLSLCTRLRKLIMKFSYFLRKIFSCFSNFSIILSWWATLSNYSSSSARNLK